MWKAHDRVRFTDRFLTITGAVDCEVPPHESPVCPCGCRWYRVCGDDGGLFVVAGHRLVDLLETERAPLPEVLRTERYQ